MEQERPEYWFEDGQTSCVYSSDWAFLLDEAATLLAEAKIPYERSGHYDQIGIFVWSGDRKHAEEVLQNMEE